ncbi:MAG: ATP-dependent metallopeptidase FtsH/Yme1/Tma family protein [Duncaniella sp.]|nr:ATP-dependent metallopeptidase FtsH/Yme1/Tma family protein [Duncaniella sp.]
MDNPNKPKKGIKFSMYWAYAIIIVFLLGMLYIDNNSLTKDVSFTKFEQYVGTGGVDKITVFTNTNRPKVFSQTHLHGQSSTRASTSLARELSPILSLIFLRPTSCRTRLMCGVRKASLKAR